MDQGNPRKPDAFDGTGGSSKARIGDVRENTARYYDAQPTPFDDADREFYARKLPSGAERVLELGCGTGRVLAPLVERCALIHGVDASEAMLAICQEKLEAREIGTERARLTLADITDLDLGVRFDCIIAPFRVFQNLEHDDQVEGFFQTVRRHLTPGGSCILNVFRPRGSVQALQEMWVERVEPTLRWEIPYGAGRLESLDQIRGFQLEPLVCYPRLTYRYFVGDKMQDEALLDIAMRCYYADEFVELIEEQGFQIMEMWGGYRGEHYGEGEELVVQFCT